ncbi:GNAT family N-acetyltransferase [Macrococcus armenti]|uniref:GNAT family N-acetyltransferase n=1 Tax=Macrococcus armenti TaxID=2875764 RepID=UPI001CCD6ECD|nr:GNAT family N-acetyltransferase [Macrococcus armenti]UBH09024.1 GNAT family N-acetyltransferase [Macrococcus armenti]UBH11317.1 GNAT family N-acetyltransferase [Macrococcus armenti]
MGEHNINKDTLQVSFSNTHNDVDVYEVNERYIHYHTPNQLIKYYANYFQYKVMPDVDTFMNDYEKQKTFHEQRGQKHALFIFPEKEVLDDALQERAKTLGFTVEKMELYLLKEMPKSKDTEIEVVQVLKENDVFLDYLEVCREGDLEYGEEFADLKARTHRRDVLNPQILQFVAYQHGFPAGKVNAVESAKYVEIDDFYVLDAMRKQGVGTALQQAVWRYASQVGKQVILIADGNDAPREMYQRQGYALVSERYELLRVPSADNLTLNNSPDNNNDISLG